MNIKKAYIPLFVLSTLFIINLLSSCGEKATEPKGCLKITTRTSGEISSAKVNDSIIFVNCGDKKPYTALYTGDTTKAENPNNLDPLRNHKYGTPNAYGFNMNSAGKYIHQYKYPGTFEVVFIVTDVANNGQSSASSKVVKQITIIE